MQLIKAQACPFLSMRAAKLEFSRGVQYFCQLCLVSDWLICCPHLSDFSVSRLHVLLPCSHANEGAFSRIQGGLLLGGRLRMSVT